MRTDRSEIVFCPIGTLRQTLGARPVVLISDRLVYTLYGTEFPDIPAVFVPEGEAAKSLDIVSYVYKAFMDAKVDRGWSVLAVGGGTVSDVAGFIASTWMRGIGFSVVPTTLLAMVDASIGGKNGINFGGTKNVVGSFLLPETIFCDTEALRSLPPEQFASGMAEVIKHAVIDGEGYFAFLERAAEAWHCADGFDFRRCPAETLQKIVGESQRIKMGFVARDFRESNERRILNLGHTFGHAIEALLHTPHGHSVALGMLLAEEFSASRGDKDGCMSRDEIARVNRLLGLCGLPDHIPADLLPEIKAACRERILMDKKREGDRMHFVLPRGIGNVTVEEIPIGELYAFLGKID